ncbi:hypothetical protein [Neisseria sp. CCUG12390]|uniref:hypothetical protein n=1 Tax=Neisseria sp. CCUG12390 TaxID=3392035 RepID=UPI003A102E50
MNNRKGKVEFLATLMKDNSSDFESVRRFSSFLISIITTIGILFIFFYIIFVINWLPIGLSLSDTLAFIILSLEFGFVFAVIYSPFYFRDLGFKVRFKSKKTNEKL